MVDSELRDVFSSPQRRVKSMEPRGPTSLQRTCADKILGMGELVPPKDLKMGEEWGPQVLNLRLFCLLLLKDPDTQMTCEHPKFGLILGAINTSFVSSLLFYLYFAQRHRGTSCLGTERPGG